MPPPRSGFRQPAFAGIALTGNPASVARGYAARENTASLVPLIPGCSGN
jgi:hypothetical protein